MGDFQFGPRRQNSGTAGPPHTLVIEDADAPGEEYGKAWRIEHDASCPRETIAIDPEGCEIEVERCAVGAYQHEFGLELLALPAWREWHDLPVGRYRIEAWWARYPSTPDHAEEWDGGIQFVDECPIGPGTRPEF